MEQPLTLGAGGDAQLASPAARPELTGQLVDHWHRAGQFSVHPGPCHPSGPALEELEPKTVQVVVSEYAWNVAGRAHPSISQGRFDMGYQAHRELVFERQKTLGVLPPGAELSPINPYVHTTSHDGRLWSELDRVRPWESLSEDERGYFAVWRRCTPVS